MNKEISRRNVDTTIYILILFFLITFLVYDTIYYDEQEHFPPKVNADTSDSLSTKTPETAISASTIANDTYAIDEESNATNATTNISNYTYAIDEESNVTTNISNEEELEEFVFDFTTYKYPEYEGISGESFERGDKIIFLGEEGTLLNGKIENGKVTSSVLQISDGQEKIMLIYYQKDHYIYGHLELIMYPQEEGKKNSAIMKQNGKELSDCLVYDSGLGYLTYVKALFEPDRVSPGLKARVFC